MAIIPVLNNDDFGAGSLRQAIADAASGDTIDLTSRFGKITLSNGQLIISGKSLTLVGPGVLDLKIDANTKSRIFDIVPGASLKISDLTLANGDSGIGFGGIIQSGGNLELSRVTVSNGLATSRGGGIYHNDGFTDYAQIDSILDELHEIESLLA